MKKFALSDTQPDPYFTIDAGGTVTFHISSLADGRSVAEICRDGKILCRVFAKSIQVAEGQRSWAASRRRRLLMRPENENAMNDLD